VSVAILNFGTLLPAALTAADTLNATVADMRFVKPLDTALILELAGSHDLLVTLEENTIAGGAGAGVSEFLSSQAITLPILHLGLPDELIEHGKHHEQLAWCGLDSEGITRAIRARVEDLEIRVQRPVQKY